MSTPREDELAELQERVATLEEAIVAVREFGEEHDNPAIERSASRLAGTVAILKQNVPGSLVED